MAYVTTANVQARLPGRTLSASSKPTLTQVGEWVEEGAALLDGALLAASLDAPYTAARALLILRSWSLLYSEGHTRMAFASAGGDGTNDDGKDMVEQFRDLLVWIRENGPTVGGMLASGDAPEASRRVRGYVIDNSDDVNITDGDFAPQFTKAAGDGQW